MTNYEPVLAPGLLPRRRPRPATTEPRGVRIALTATVIALLGVLLFAPLVAVFAEALREGIAVAATSLAAPEARSAIRLTLTVAAIAVPLNAVLGIAAAWAIAKFDFRGKAFLITLIDLPYSVSPVVAGLCMTSTSERRGAAAPLSPIAICSEFILGFLSERQRRGAVGRRAERRHLGHQQGQVAHVPAPAPA